MDSTPCICFMRLHTRIVRGLSEVGMIYMATNKQRKAAKIMVGNGGVATPAMIQAGYSPKTVKTPQKLTTSKGFKEIWAQMIPKDLVITTHRRIINKVDKDGQPHADAVKGVDMAYKVEGSYAPDKTINVNVEVEATAEIKALTQKLNELYGS